MYVSFDLIKDLMWQSWRNMRDNVFVDFATLVEKSFFSTIVHNST